MIYRKFQELRINNRVMIKFLKNLNKEWKKEKLKEKKLFSCIKIFKGFIKNSQKISFKKVFKDFSRI